MSDFINKDKEIVHPMFKVKYLVKKMNKEKKR